jgi:hypothetical protein
VPSIAAQWLPSASQDTVAAFQVAALSDLFDAHIGFGTAASSPGTFGALANSGQLYGQGLRQATWSRMAGIGTLTGILNLFALGSVGDLAWVCLFVVNPVGASVPLAVAGPFTVGP